jgi:hypothetical protein
MRTEQLDGMQEEAAKSPWSSDNSDVTRNNAIRR